MTARNHGPSENDLVTDARFAPVPRHGYRLKSQTYPVDLNKKVRAVRRAFRAERRNAGT
jgi:hypothetical protein